MLDCLLMACASSDGRTRLGGGLLDYVWIYGPIARELRWEVCRGNCCGGGYWELGMC